MCKRNETSFRLDITDFGKNGLYKNFYYWFTAVVFAYIPLALLCVFNVLLVGAVRDSQKQRDGLTQVTNNEYITVLIRYLGIVNFSNKITI